MSGVNLVFGDDTRHALRGAAALVNTMAGSVPGDTDVDRLTTVAELDAFVATWRWTGSRTHDQAELRRGPRAAPEAAPRGGPWTKPTSSPPSTPPSPRRTPSLSSSTTTAGAGTCTPPGPRHRWPPGWPSRRPWRSSTWSGCGELDRLGICAAPGLRRRRRRPVQEPLPNGIGEGTCRQSSRSSDLTAERRRAVRAPRPDPASLRRRPSAESTDRLGRRAPEILVLSRRMGYGPDGTAEGRAGVER